MYKPYDVEWVCAKGIKHECGAKSTFQLSFFSSNIVLNNLQQMQDYIMANKQSLKQHLNNFKVVGRLEEDRSVINVEEVLRIRP